MKNRIYIISLSVLFSIIIWASVNLSGTFYTSLELPIKVINIKDGYGLNSHLPDFITVKIKAQGWKLVGLFVNKSFSFNLNTSNDIGKLNLRFINSVPENPWISSELQIIDINPSSVNLNIEKLHTKTLKILPNVNLSFSEGFGLAKSIYVMPETLVISGPARFIDTINSIYTKKIEFNKVDESFTTETDIDYHSNITVFPEKVKLYFDIQRIVEKEFTNLPIIISGVPNDRTVLVMPDKIKLSLRAGINYLGKIKNEDIRVSLNYQDIIQDTIGSLSPYIEVPKYTKILSKNPERVKYIIKKYK